MTNDSLSQRVAGFVRDARTRTDVSQTADDIVAAATELFPQCSGAGITLVHRRGGIESAAISTHIVGEGDRLQHELGEGPCLDAIWEQEQVCVGDLAQDERWPRWSPRIVEMGVRSMLCTRLFTNEDQLGALDLYAEEPHAFHAEDEDVAQLLAAHAAVAVAAAHEIETLRLAVDRRTTIGKALGIIMARYGLSDDQAMSVLRRLSSHQNRKLYDIALDVVREVRVPTEDL